MMSKTAAEPLVRISKREGATFVQKVLVRAIAILLALVVDAFFIFFVTGLNPISVYGVMWNGTFMNTTRFSWALRLWRTLFSIKNGALLYSTYKRAPPFNSGLAGKLIQNSRNFIQFFTPFLLVARLGRLQNATLHMRPDNLLICPLQHGLCRHDLIGDVNTVLVPVNHLQDAVNLPSGRFQQAGHLRLIRLHIPTSFRCFWCALIVNTGNLVTGVRHRLLQHGIGHRLGHLGYRVFGLQVHGGLNTLQAV